ncbi:glycosyltransferase family 4 protein [Sphingomonas sp. 1P06PA]|uniref:glycosyltransferase n=1 Tax=Sphingomonas sp. 1P06PA TaxID=554121 RepID=UPI0039A6478C
MVSRKADGRQLQRIALIGNYPPRLCGIATFTAHVRDALVEAYPDLDVDAYAMDDPGSAHLYPADVVQSIRQHEMADYQSAAARINDSDADVVLVQHEYGIFGGPAGALLLRLLDRVAAPVVVTLHTVLEQPNADQRSVVEALVRRASKLIVMAEKGREILMRVHGVPAERIAVVPHGVPDRPMAEPSALAGRFGLEGRRVLLTFGLLSPNKGIETMIRALTAIVADDPTVLYVVLGATHPHLVAHEGEAYRESLQSLASELGVADHVRFIDRFVEQEELLDHIEAAEIYVTPYLNEAQITSGTLSYAVALGKPVVSTPYWHAAELLGDGTGALVDFGDAAGFAGAIRSLLADPDRLGGLRAAAYGKGRSMTWSCFAKAYYAILVDAAERRPIRLRATLPAMTAVPPSLTGVERMTDGCGMLQHSIFSVPDRDHGYCVDDNCRALMLMHRVDGDASERADDLANVYASFVQHAWNGERGRFRNFMGYDRSWLESEGSEDSFGRSLWSLGVTAGEARRPELRRWASHLFDQVAPHALELGSPRTWAFAVLGADAMLDVMPGNGAARRIIRSFGPKLMSLLAEWRRPNWHWFESVLGYDNARLPEALMRCGVRLGDEAMLTSGLETLGWLDDIQIAPEGHFRAVGTDSFGQPYSPPRRFDQQPLEAWASCDAAAYAFEQTGDVRWRDAAWRAYRWYLGDNDIGVPIAAPSDGGCFDGLMSDRANLNQGAESVLAFQFACCTIAALDEKAGSTERRGISLP